MGFSNQNDEVVALQMVGPTEQGALVIPGEDNNDLSKINLPPTLHVRAVQAKEKPPTSYTFTLIKKQEGSKPPSHSFKSMATNMVSPSPLMSFNWRQRVFTWG